MDLTPFSTAEWTCVWSTTDRSAITTACAGPSRPKGFSFTPRTILRVAAGYLTWRLREGDSLEAALEAALEDLDGFFTFAVGHRHRLRGAARSHRL